MTSEFFPSVLDMAGLPLLPQQHVDGVSIKMILQGSKKLDREAIFWHFPHYSNYGMQSPSSAVRSGKFKLIEYNENGTVQLFDLDKDSS